MERYRRHVYTSHLYLNVDQHREVGSSRVLEDVQLRTYPDSPWISQTEVKKIASPHLAGADNLYYSTLWPKLVRPWMRCSNAMSSQVQYKYKSSQLQEFIQELREVVDDQEREVKRAVIGRHGKYQFKVSYNYVYLVVSEEKWFEMMEQQRPVLWLKQVPQHPHVL